MNKDGKTILVPGSYTSLAVTAETITIPAGAAGSVVNFYFLKKPIADSGKSFVGGKGDTSIALTSTTFTTEVSEKPDSELANGEYYIDYISGKGRGKKANGGISMTANYSIFV